jgi:hypothetical protein
VENLSVEKFAIKLSSTGPVEKLFFSTIALWRNFCCGSNEKRTFPTFSSNFKRSWRENSNNALERWKHMCKKNGVIPLVISTADDPALRLSRFFAIKEKV